MIRLCTRSVCTTFITRTRVKNTKSQRINALSVSLKARKMLRPIGIFQNWDLNQYTVKNVDENCNRGIELIKASADQVASAQTLSYDTILKPILEAHRLYGERGVHGSLLNLPRYVADSKDLRDAVVSAKAKIDAEFVELEMRKDVYGNLVKYSAQLEYNSEGDGLSEEKRKCLNRLLLYGRRNGLQLDEDTREKAKELKKCIINYSLEFMKNLGDDNSVVLVDSEELRGMDEVFINTLETGEGGKLKVTMKYPHYLPLMSRCVVPETRRKMELAFNSRCLTENTKLLEQIVELRASRAKLLGYPDHASFNLEILMAKDTRTVDNFIQDIVEKFTPLWAEERKALLELKKNECERLGLDFDGQIHMWDTRRFTTLYSEAKYSLNQEQLKEYFPLPVVTKGLLGIYEDLLGLRFTHLPDAEKWNSDVDVYQVNDSQTDELMGYFYLDLFPRDGKYGHACCQPSQQGCLDDESVKQPAVVALICNFPRPTAHSPSLLSHDDVETIFHEFGHAMHAICCRAETAFYFGTYVQSDFLEAPSQMLENWCYEKESLQRMSSHYKTKDPIPDEIISKLIESKKANEGIQTLRQMVYALVDQRMHKEGRYELKKMFADTLKELTGLEATSGGNTLASFGHMCNNYDAKYYGYMWSQVYSTDMFETVFKKHGILSPVAGQLYRKSILEPGGSKDGMELLLEFLGREPLTTPFFRSKGIEFPIPVPGDGEV